MPAALPPAQDTLTPSQARRLTLRAQGFGALPSTAIDRGHLRRLLTRLGVLQIDSVNALARSHYLPLFARLGAKRFHF